MSYHISQTITIQLNTEVMLCLSDFIRPLTDNPIKSWLEHCEVNTSNIPGMIEVHLVTGRGIPIGDICNIFRETGASGNYGDGASYINGDCCCMRIFFRDGDIIQIQEKLVTWDDSDMSEIIPITSLNKIYSKSEIENFKKEHDIEVSPRLDIDDNLPF